MALCHGDEPDRGPFFLRRIQLVIDQPELLSNLFTQTVGKFCMSRDGRRGDTGGIVEEIVLSTVALEVAALLLKKPNKFFSFQAWTAIGLAFAFGWEWVRLSAIKT